jgi:hypothetical protein
MGRSSTAMRYSGWCRTLREGISPGRGNRRSGELPPYLQGKKIEIRKCVAKIRTGSHWLEIQQGRFTKPQTERENRLCKKNYLGVVEDEIHVVFVCPLSETLRVKYSEYFRDATNLNSAFNSAQIARFLYDCYMMHVESVAET